MRDIELYQKLLGLTAPWRVTAVAVGEASGHAPLGEMTVHVSWPPDGPLHCPECEARVPGDDTRPRRWRHLNTMQWKTFIEANVPRVHCPQCGVKQIPVAWAEDGSRVTEL
ncbi:transposase, partial [mine drainage metagenome]